MPAEIVPLAYSLIKTGIGAANKKKAEAEAEELKRNRPKYGISPDATNELNLAESELQQGLGARAERAYTTQMDKGLSGSLSAILKGGGNVNSIGDLYGNADDGMQRLAMLNENTRLNKINNLVSARRNMTEQRDKGFMYNEDQWWKNDAAANAVARTDANNEMWSGINSAVGQGTQLLQDAYEKKQMDKFLNPEKYAKKSKSDQLGNPSGTNYGFTGTQENNNFDSGQDFYQYNGDSGNADFG